MTHKDARRGGRSGHQAGRGGGGDVAVLEAERKFYEAQKPELLKTHPGQFALIHDHELAGVFTTFGEAYGEGVKRYGLKSFLVQQILDPEPHMQHPALDVGAITVRR